MDYGAVIVVRDKERKRSYITLRDKRIVYITDNGDICETDSIPPVDPPHTPTREQRVFVLQPYPYTGLEIPPYPVEKKIERLLQDSKESAR